MENGMIISTDAENTLYSNQCLFMIFKKPSHTTAERNSLTLRKVFFKTTAVNTSFLKWQISLKQQDFGNLLSETEIKPVWSLFYF